MDRRRVLTVSLAAAASASSEGWAIPAQSLQPWESLPAPAPLPAGGATGLVSHDGAEIYYVTYGSGPPVILLHGGFANGRYWGNQVPDLLGAEYQVILIDSRGHGRSSRDQRPYTYELMQSDVVAVMDRLKIHKASVVGWSDGAIIGLVMALRAPKRLSRLFAFAANMDPTGVRTDTMDHPVFARFEDQAAQEYRVLSPTPHDFSAFSRAINRMWDTEPNYAAAALHQIRTPTAIVDGDHDEAIKREHTEYLAREIPGAELIILPGVSHFAMLQAPAAFNAAMLGFLKA
jgi:pimeloyl-ACP methyl ester carboxylesterase